MSSGLEQLIEERQALVARCAAQRAQLSAAIDGVRRGLVPAQAALGAWNAVKAHPLLIGLAAVAATAAGPRRLLSWAGTGLTLYSLVRRIAQLVRA